MSRTRPPSSRSAETKTSDALLVEKRNERGEVVLIELSTLPADEIRSAWANVSAGKHPEIAAAIFKLAAERGIELPPASPADGDASASPPVSFSRREVDLLRQWFNAVEDLNPAYLTEADYALAAKIAEALGTRAPTRKPPNP